MENMNKLSKNAIQILAYDRGQEAFKMNIKRAPCLDPALMGLIDVGADSNLVCTNWLKGWDAANLEAD